MCWSPKVCECILGYIVPDKRMAMFVVAWKHLTSSRRTSTMISLCIARTPPPCPARKAADVLHACGKSDAGWPRLMMLSTDSIQYALDLRAVMQVCRILCGFFTVVAKSQSTVLSRGCFVPGRLRFGVYNQHHQSLQSHTNYLQCCRLMSSASEHAEPAGCFVWEEAIYAVHRAATLGSLAVLGPASPVVLQVRPNPFSLRFESC